MKQPPFFISSTSSMLDFINRPLRTSGCIVIFGIEGEAVAECNFTDVTFAKGSLAIIFSDTLFSFKEISPNFMARYFELSVALSDDATFTTAGALFDWLCEHPIVKIDYGNNPEFQLWLSSTDWIEKNTSGKYRNIMLRNQWQNFFLGLEIALKKQLENHVVKTISPCRKLFHGFCRLLSENCRHHHEVKFYADRLCITPYYLSRITRRTFSASPKELIDRQILMEIKSILTSTDLSIKEIADMYNFESSSYLGRYFRRHIGMTPSEYRNSHN